MRSQHDYRTMFGQSLVKTIRFYESNPPEPEKKVDPPKKEETAPVAKQIDETTVEINGRRFIVQDKVNDLVGSARTEGKTAGEQAAKDEAERAARESQGEFQKLYDEAKPKLEETETKLTAAETELKALNDEIEKDVKELLKALPDKAQKLLPEGLTPVQKRNWLRDAIEALGDTKDRKPGPNGNPPAGGGSTDEERLEETRKRLRRTGVYGRL